MPTPTPQDWIDDVVADLPALATIPETAKTLRVSQRTIRRYMSAGRLRSVQHGAAGGRVLISRTEVRRYLSSIDPA